MGLYIPRAKEKTKKLSSKNSTFSKNYSAKAKGKIKTFPDKQTENLLLEDLFYAKYQKSSFR